MKRLWKSRRSQSASSGIVAPAPRPAHKPAAKSVSGWTQAELTNEALCARAQQTAQRLIELVSTVERSKLWTHSEIQELYRECRTHEASLNAAIARHGDIARMSSPGATPHALRASGGDVTLSELCTASRAVQDAFQACADRLADGYDPEVRRVHDDCKIARERAAQLRLLDVDALYNVDGETVSKSLVSGCLHSRESLRTSTAALADVITAQALLRTVGMPELFADSFCTAEETLLRELQDVVRDVADVLAYWMDSRRRTNAATFGSSPPAQLTPLSPLPPLTDSAESPSSITSPLATPASRKRLPLPLSLKASLAGSSSAAVQVLINDGAYDAYAGSTDEDVYNFTIQESPSSTHEHERSFHIGNGFGMLQDTPMPLSRRGALRRRRYSLPSVRSSLLVPECISSTLPALEDGTWASVNFSTQASNGSSLLSFQSASCGNLRDSWRREEMPVEPIEEARSVPCVPVDDGPGAPRLPVLSAGISLSSSLAQSDFGTGLTDVYARYYVDSPPATNARNSVLSSTSVRSFSLRLNLDDSTRELPAWRTATTWAAAAPQSTPGPVGRGVRKESRTVAEPAVANVGDRRYLWPLDTNVGSTASVHRYPSDGRAGQSKAQLADANGSPWAFCQDLTGTIYSMTPRPCNFGGLADVYRAWWMGEKDTMLVAIKVLRTHSRQPEKTLRRLQREIRVWQQLDHVHVLPLCGIYFGVGDLPALVSPWCKHGDICTYLRGREGQPNLMQLKLKLLQQILEGLKYLHGCTPEVVHGDLKGANILISDTDDVRLCDFGFASMHAEEEGSLLFQSSSAKGTWRWMSPELLAHDDARHTKESDIWAFGCVVVEVLSGKVPYHEKRNDQSVIMAISRGEHPSRPDNIFSEPWETALHNKVWELTTDCWTSDPDERPPVGSVLRRLRHWRAKFNVARG